MLARSNRAEVRNPMLALGGMRALMQLPPPMREAFAIILVDLGQQADHNAEKCWRTRKAPMAAYWRAVAVYARHTARALRRGA